MVCDEEADVECDSRTYSVPIQWSRMSIPIAHIFNESMGINGAITFTFTNSREDQIPNVVYDVTHESSLTLRYDYWGHVETSYEKHDFSRIVNTTEPQPSYEMELLRRIPTKDHKGFQDE